MYVLPAATPVATPALPAALLTVALVASEEAHVAEAVRNRVLPLLYVPTAVNCCVLPTVTDAVPGCTAIETNVAVGSEAVPEAATEYVPAPPEKNGEPATWVSAPVVPSTENTEMLGLLQQPP